MNEMNDEQEDYGSPYEGRQLIKQPFIGGLAGNAVQAIDEYVSAMEREKYKRQEIEAKRTAALSLIRTERRLLNQYLNHRFGERSELYAKYFNLIDTALQIGNEEILSIALESIQNIYQDNPAAGIGEFRRHIPTMSGAVHI
jgi:hypothetical protein